MLEFPEHVRDTVERNRMFRPGNSVGVAVSGGADSVALLHALLELAPRWDLRLKVLHVNHLLRGADADGDARFVQNIARSLGIEFEEETVDVRRAARDSADNLEQAARLVRYRFFLAKLRNGELDRVATGHNRSDQAETVLYRLLRGAGTAGLAAIRPVTKEGIVRPLIELSRDQVRDYLRQCDIAWREDHTNADKRLDRNRIRLNLLPLLAREWNPAIETTLARMASVAADEEAYWESEIHRLSGELLVDRAPAVLISRDRLRPLPAAVTRRLLRAAIGRVRGDLRRIDAGHVERVIELVRSGSGAGRISLPGAEVARSFEWIRVAPPESPSSAINYQFELPVPGEVKIPPRGHRLRCELVNRGRNDGYNEREGSELDWGRVSGSLDVRNYRSGDRFQPAGRPVRKMKEWFQLERVPLWDRSGWPMVTCGDSIVWTRRLGVAEGYATSARSTRVVRIFESEAGGRT